MKEYFMQGYITQEERETVIRYDYQEKKWYMDSSIPTHYNKALKQGWKQTSVTKNELGNIQAMTLECDNPKAISIRNAEPIKRQMTDEQKQKASERMKNLRKNVKNQ